MKPQSYSLVLNSADRISGNNNNPTFQVNWDDFLPREYQKYKIIFSFQSTAGGYQDDNYFTYNNNPPGSAFSATALLTYPAGTTVLPDITRGNILGFCVFAGNSFGVQPYTKLVDCYPNYFKLDKPTIQTIDGGITGNYVSFFLVNPSYVQSIQFSSARINVNFNSRSYSYDTGSKCPSLTLGVIQRDAQFVQSSSNSMQAFYGQNPPRVIDRPTNNLLTFSIYNNYFYNGSNNNLLFDNLNQKKEFALLIHNMYDVAGQFLNSYTLDMTPWTMVMQFIPVIE